MSSDFFHRSFSLDISILNSLQSLLLKTQVASEFTLDQAQYLLLEQPFPLKPIDCLDNFNLYSNEELTNVIKQNMKDYHHLLEVFGKVNEERKLLRKNNIALLQRLFCMEFGGIGENDRDFHHFLNKIVFLNNDFMKKHILKLEKQIQTKDEELNKKSSDMLDLKQQIHRLERKLQSSRESFKNYLVNGKTEELPITGPPQINQNASNPAPNFPSITSIHISDDETVSPADILEASKKKEETIKNLKRPLTSTKIKPLASDITKSKKGLLPESKKLQFDSKPKTPSARVSIDFGVKKPLALNLKEKEAKVLPTSRTVRSFTMITPSSTEIKNPKKAGVGVVKKEEGGGKKEGGGGKKEEGGKKVEGGGKKTEGAKKMEGAKKDEGGGGKTTAATHKGVVKKK